MVDKDKITKELESGICELTIVSDHCSASRTISATLSPNHLPDTKTKFSDNSNMIIFWDVVDEQWETMHLSTIGDIERLTGIGVKDETDLVQDETLASIFTDEA